MTRPFPARWNLRLFLLFVTILEAPGCCYSQQLELPVDRRGLEKLGEKTAYESGVTNYLDSAQLQAVVRGGSKEGLQVDFSHVKQLTNGTKIDPAKIYGSVQAGPYPFEGRETGFKYRRYRLESSIVGGKAVLDVGALLNPSQNSERWIDRGQLGILFTIFLEDEGKDRFLGSYTTLVAFKKKDELYLRVPGLVGGPFINQVSSDAPGQVTISFISEEKVKGKVFISGGKDGQRILYQSNRSLKRKRR